jgi:hypothetical protein
MQAHVGDGQTRTRKQPGPTQQGVTPKDLRIRSFWTERERARGLEPVWTELQAEGIWLAGETSERAGAVAAPETQATSLGGGASMVAPVLNLSIE